jgi:hypothetical protein
LNTFLVKVFKRLNNFVLDKKGSQVYYNFEIKNGKHHDISGKTFVLGPINACLKHNKQEGARCLQRYNPFYSDLIFAESPSLLQAYDLYVSKGT